MSDRIIRFLVPAFSASAHVAAYFQFILKIETMALPAEWKDQFLFLLLLSFSLALVLPFCRNAVLIWILLAFKGILLIVIGLPLSNYLGVEMTLLAALIVEILMYTSLWYGLLAGTLFASLTVFLQQLTIIAWGEALPRASTHDTLSFGVYSGIILMLGSLIRYQRDNLVPTAELNRRLHEATLQLAQVNMQLQEYAALSEQEAIQAERKRLAREIHDTIAYTLTNLVMMMEAALDMARDAGISIQEHLTRARDQAKEGLAEVRLALQALRPVKMNESTGLPAIKRLVETFAKATQMDVSLSLGNVPLNLGEEADWAAYRLVQEGMTNALRHGRATRVMISFSMVGAGIGIQIRDNGIGTNGCKEGYGLLGMRERIDRLGGKLEFNSKQGEGFILSAWFPVKER